MAGYKLLHISNFYPEYLKSYYDKFPEITKKSFKDQYAHLMNDTCEPKIHMLSHFQSFGAETCNIITNALPLQNAWQSDEKSNQKGKKKLILEQIKKFQPDVVWIDDISLINSEYLNQIRDEIPHLKLLITSFCTNYNSEILHHLKAFDFVITCTPGLNNFFNNLGLKSYLVYFGFEPSVLKILDIDNPYEISKFLFTGSLYSGSGNHNLRLQYIQEIIKEGIPVSIYGNIEKISKVRLKQAYYVLLKTLRVLHLQKIIKHVSFLKKHEDYGMSPVLGYSRELRKRIKPPVFGLNMFKLMSKAQIIFNQHADIAGDFAGNIRLFEATGVGSCLLTDHKKNITDLFIPDYEIVTYNSINECIEKIKWLLDHPKEVEKVAEAGQKRTLKDHTMIRRAEQINEIILNEIYRRK